MNILELFIIAIALSMDAFAVSICKGVTIKKVTVQNSIVVGLYFGLFQAIMPLAGYLLGHGFHSKIEFIDHWIVFVVLGFIGLNMIKESRNCGCDSKSEVKDTDPLWFKGMIFLAIATSIDALAVGVTFAILDIDNINLAVSLIGVTTFIISFVGVKIGSFVGNKFKSRAEAFGGIVLIAIGTKTLLEHLSLLNF